MEALETRILARLGIADPYAGLRARGPRPDERQQPGTQATSRDKTPRPGPTVFDRLRSLFGLCPASIRDDIEDALEETDDRRGVLGPGAGMLRNVLDLHEIRVEDVMVPRADIIAVGST